MCVEGACDGRDRARSDLMPAGDQIGELADDPFAGAGLALLAVERQQVAAQVDTALQVGLEGPQNGILAARQLGGDFVG